MLTLRSLLMIATLASVSAAARAAIDLPEDLGGVQSPYGKVIGDILKTWPSPHFETLAKDKSPGEIKIQRITHPDNDFYIGYLQYMKIQAPMKTVEAVLDDVTRFPELFNSLVKAEVRERSGDSYTVYSEQNIPVPFVPNEKDEMLYRKVSPGFKRTIYRYQLKKSNNLKMNDGLIVLEDRGDNTTDYYEADFWDADWGMAKSFGVDRVWTRCLEGLTQSSLAIKYRAENLATPLKDVKEKSKKAVEDLPIADWLKGKKSLLEKEAMQAQQ